MVSEMDTVKSVTNSVNSAYPLANPSPQAMHSPKSVGHEFVRQYYTMLNRAPQLLYRFYSDDSTFIHGCLDKHGESVQCVRGQKQINTKILSLNFQNCHTKIRQVDSMETIGNGVVIQVIGELSNNGQPLRRFLQTFVLTPQSPNKYYVRNDIFRYHDEFFGEELDEQIEKAEFEPKIEHNTEVDNLQPSHPIEKDYSSYQSNGTMTNPAAVAAAVVATAAEQASVVDEGVDLQEEPESVQESSIEVNTSMADVTDNNNSKEQPLEPEEEEEVESVSMDTPLHTNQHSNEPKTYANMVSKSFQAAVAASAPTSNLNVIKPVPVNAAPVAPPAVNDHVAEPPVVTQPPTHKNASGFPPQRDRFANKKGGGSFNRRSETRENAKSINNDADSADGESHFNAAAPKKVFPDDHQVFIGNLLPNFSEDDLASVFSRYGKIVDIRINRQSHKTNSNKANRNYGFITFESADVVDQIVNQKQAIFHGNHRYNVEKKQSKSNFDRPPRNNNQASNGPRNGGPPSNAPNNLPPRHMQANVGGQGGNPGQQRSRPGQNYQNSANNRNFSNGQNYSNRNSFGGGHPQNR